MSKTGVIRFPWKLIQPLLRYRLKSVLDEAYSGVKNIPDDDKDLSRQLLERFDRFKEYEIHSKIDTIYICMITFEGLMANLKEFLRFIFR